MRARGGINPKFSVADLFGAAVRLSQGLIEEVDIISDCVGKFSRGIRPFD